MSLPGHVTDTAGYFHCAPLKKQEIKEIRQEKKHAIPKQTGLLLSIYNFFTKTFNFSSVMHFCNGPIECKGKIKNYLNHLLLHEYYRLSHKTTLELFSFQFCI